MLHVTPKSKTDPEIVLHLRGKSSSKIEYAGPDNSLTPPKLFIIAKHILIDEGGSGPRQGVMPKPGFYEGFYIHLMILRASVSWVDYPYVPVLSPFYIQRCGRVNKVHSAYNIQDYTRQTA